MSPMSLSQIITMAWKYIHDGLFRPKMLQVVEIYRFIYIYQSSFV